jgi:hypothetical protein
VKVPLLQEDGTWSEHEVDRLVMVIEFPPAQVVFWKSPKRKVQQAARIQLRRFERRDLDFEVPWEPLTRLETKLPRFGYARAAFYVETTWNRGHPHREAEIQKIGKQYGPWIFTYFTRREAIERFR